MKKRNKHIDEKVNKSLAFLDNMEKVEASPFFNTRLEARLEKQTDNKSFFSFLFTTQYNLKPVLIGLVLLVNVLSISIFMINTNSASKYSNEISNLLETYAFDQSEYYVLTSNEE
jgi:hypothetical protein